MKYKIDTLFDYIKNLSESDLNQIINFVLGIVSVNQMPQDRPECLYCGGTHVIKYGHRKGKQRFWYHNCKRTFMHSTNTLMANSHFSNLHEQISSEIRFMMKLRMILRKNMVFLIKPLLTCGTKCLWLYKIY